MENPNEKEDSTLSKQITTELFKKSAALKKRNNIVLQKLSNLKRQADELLKSGSGPKR